MIEVAPDILYFEKYLDRDLTKNALKLLDEKHDEMFDRELRAAQFPFHKMKGRLELYDYPELMDQFNNFWFSKVEDMMLDYYLMHVPHPEGIPDDVYADAIGGLKLHAQTDWKDVFLIHYLSDVGNHQNHVHIDFSGFTFIACLDDKYEGGYLELPKQNYKIKLGKRDLILFPGGFTHPHGVTPILSGDRKVLVGQSMGPKQLHKFGKEI